MRVCGLCWFTTADVCACVCVYRNVNQPPKGGYDVKMAGYRNKPGGKVPEVRVARAVTYAASRLTPFAPCVLTPSS